MPRERPQECPPCHGSPRQLTRANDRRANFVETLVCLTPGASVVTLEGYAGLDNNIESARSTGMTTCPANIPRTFETAQCTLTGRVCVASHPGPHHRLTST